MTETQGLWESDPRGLDQHEPGAKLDAGKLRAGILVEMRHALLAVAKVCDYGSRKYTIGGWSKVPDPQRRYRDAMWRHLLAGDGNDDDSNDNSGDDDNANDDD